MEIVANALVYVGGYVFLVFMAVCLATGACDARTRRRRDAMRSDSLGDDGAATGGAAAGRIARTWIAATRREARRGARARED